MPRFRARMGFPSAPHTGDDCTDWLPLRGEDAVGPGGLRHDAGLGVVQGEGREGLPLADQESPLAFHQIDDMDAAVSADRQLFFRADTVGVQEFPLVQPGALHGSVFIPIYYRNCVYQIFSYPLGIPLPLNVGHTVLQVDGAGSAV